MGNAKLVFYKVFTEKQCFDGLDGCVFWWQCAMEPVQGDSIARGGRIGRPVHVRHPSVVTKGCRV